MQDYVVEPLCRAAIISAYPLVHLTAPSLGLPAWKREARVAIDGRHQGARGILVARRTLRKHICGMVWYRSHYDLTNGKILEATNFIAIDILDPRGLLLHLLDALNILARAHNCSRVRIILPHSAGLSASLSHAVRQLQLVSSVNDCTEIGFLI